MRVSVFCALFVVATLLLPRTAGAVEGVTFDQGSLIIPMDVDYQDAGMLKAFGLLDSLLRGGVPVAWCIKTPKVVVDAANGRFEADFTAAARDYKTNAAIASRGYRGGPFVVAAGDAARAAPIITSWQAANTTTVHVATGAFNATISRRLTAAPRIAVFSDGNQGIAFSYLNAAGVRDELGNTWTNSSPGVLTPAQVSGPSTSSHNDGALFRPSGQPAYCEVMTMHWNVNSTEIPEVTAEFAEFLKFPVHLNAECQAVNAVEGAPPIGGRSNFVASKGFVWPAPNQPNAVQFSNSSLPFAQMDGPFKTIGGSEPAYGLGSGSSYFDNIVMVRAANQPPGVQDIWMTGYAKGSCPINSEGCHAASLGKVSYLGGHQYDVKTPISTNPTTQGTRLFLNSLYETGCVTTEGQPQIELWKYAPPGVTDSQLTYTMNYWNAGYGPALDMVISDHIPAGTTFVSASNGGAYSNGTVTWNIGDLAKLSGGSVTLTVSLGAKGTYANAATATFKVGIATKTVDSNTAQTTWGDCVDDSNCGSPLVCDEAASYACVECTPSKTAACAGNGACVGNVCKCSTDSECGGALSGRACDGATERCVSGCRGDGTGNGCPAGTECTSTSAVLGRCVPILDAGGPDGGAADGGSGDDASASDGGEEDATVEGGIVDAGADDAEADAGSTDAGEADVQPSGDAGDDASSSDAEADTAGADASQKEDAEVASDPGPGGGDASQGNRDATTAYDTADHTQSGDGAAPGESGGCACNQPGTGGGTDRLALGFGLLLAAASRYRRGTRVPARGERRNGRRPSRSAEDG